jgi:hypothetical protein
VEVRSAAGIADCRVKRRGGSGTFVSSLSTLLLKNRSTSSNKRRMDLRTNYTGLGLGRVEVPLESAFGGAESGFGTSFRNCGKSRLSLASTSITGDDNCAAFENGFFAIGVCGFFAIICGFFAIGICGFFAVGVGGAVVFVVKCFEITTGGGNRAFVPCLRDAFVLNSDALTALSQTAFAPCELGQY